jgi:proteasome lid subunit RPN8/RPN11
MIRIDTKAWQVMVAHAEKTYPDECCGAMVGETADDGTKTVRLAVPMRNSYEGSQEDRYELHPEDLLKADREARARGLDLIGIFHSHPDCDAYFSQTDLKNSCPWYSFVVLSVQKGRFHHAASFLPDADQTVAEKEELIYAKDSDSHTAAAVRG